MWLLLVGTEPLCAFCCGLDVVSSAQLSSMAAWPAPPLRLHGAISAGRCLLWCCAVCRHHQLLHRPAAHGGESNVAGNSVACICVEISPKYVRLFIQVKNTCSIFK